MQIFTLQAKKLCNTLLARCRAFMLMLLFAFAAALLSFFLLLASLFASFFLFLAVLLVFLAVLLVFLAAFGLFLLAAVALLFGALRTNRECKDGRKGHQHKLLHGVQ